MSKDSMNSYTSFATVYDMFMDNIPYDDWCNYLKGLLKEYGTSSGIVLDLGCGTGSITKRLARAGYDMIGIDNSEEMLSIAMEKAAMEGDSILYLLQDMREFELYGTVSAVVSICDSMNYIMEEDDLLEVFRLVNNYLDTKGVFIFDMNTEYKYENILADNTIAENRDNGSFIWENYYYTDEKVNEYDLTIYIKEDYSNEEAYVNEGSYGNEEAYSDGEPYCNKDDTSPEPEQSTRQLEEASNRKGNDQAASNIFHRFEETHYQKAYSIEKVKELICKAGMEFVCVYDAFTHNPPTKTSERVYFVARESRQDNKYYTES